MPYGDQNFKNIDSANGLMPGSTKPLPDPTMTHHQRIAMSHISAQYTSEIIRDL